MFMRTALLVAAAAAAFVVTSHTIRAQLLAPDDAGLTMGHVLLNVGDVAAHRDFWIKQFDAKPLTVGKLRESQSPALPSCSAPKPPPVRARARRSTTWG